VAPAGYALHVPAGASGSVVTALSLIPPANRATWRLHRVQDGDTLDEIARLYRTTPQQIALANPACVDEIAPGGLLIVPATPVVKKPTTRRVAAARTTVSKVKKAGTPVTAAAAKKPATKPASTATAPKPKTGSPKTSPVASKRSGAAGSSSASAR